MLKRTQILAAGALALAACIVVSQSSAQTPPLASLENTQEVKLTEQIITNWIAAQKESLPLQKQSMEAAQQQMKEKGLDGMNTEPDPKMLIAMDALAKKHGFASAQDLINTGTTMMPYAMGLMFGTDPKPIKDDSAVKRSQYEAEIADVAKDATLDDKQKAEVTGELKKELDRIKPILYPENFDVVMKMKDQIKASMQTTMTETLESLGDSKAP